VGEDRIRVRVLGCRRQALEEGWWHNGARVNAAPSPALWSVEGRVIANAEGERSYTTDEQGVRA